MAVHVARRGEGRWNKVYTTEPLISREFTTTRPGPPPRAGLRNPGRIIALWVDNIETVKGKPWPRDRTEKFGSSERRPIPTILGGHDDAKKTQGLI